MSTAMKPARATALLLLAGLAACGSVPTRTFEFRAIDTDERPLSCLLVVGDGWDDAAEKQQIMKGADALQVIVAFDKPTVDVTIMQVALDSDGKMVAPPRSRSSPSEYRSEIRSLGLKDPTKQLFILERRER